jgi:hypothetical protein
MQREIAKAEFGNSDQQNGEPARGAFRGPSREARHDGLGG